MIKCPPVHVRVAMSNSGCIAPVRVRSSCRPPVPRQQHYSGPAFRCMSPRGVLTDAQSSWTMRIGITIACCCAWPASALLCGCIRLCRLTTTRTCLSQWTRPAWGLQWLSGQLYVQAFNVRHRSRGTLWGLLMSCSVHTERYVLKVLSCIKLDSMCARLVALPNECRW